MFHFETLRVASGSFCNIIKLVGMVAELVRRDIHFLETTPDRRSANMEDF